MGCFEKSFGLEHYLEEFMNKTMSTAKIESKIKYFKENIYHFTHQQSRNSKRFMNRQICYGDTYENQYNIALYKPIFRYSNDKDLFRETNIVDGSFVRNPDLGSCSRFKYFNDWFVIDLFKNHLIRSVSVTPSSTCG